MRFQIINTLRSLGKRSDFRVDTLHPNVHVRWLPNTDDAFVEPEYVFQIGDGVPKHSLMKILSTDSKVKIFLVMALDQNFLDKTVRDLSQTLSLNLSGIRFISVQGFRTTMDTSLSKVIFGTAVLGSKTVPNLKQTGSMPNLVMKTGLTITKIGKDLGYNTRNPAEDVFTWFMVGDKIKVLEAAVGDGFKFQTVKKLNNSDAKKKVYISVKLYGDTYKASVDKLVRIFPDTMIEFMSVAEVQTTKDLEDLLRKRLEGYVRVKEKIAEMKPKKNLFGGW